MDIDGHGHRLVMHQANAVQAEHIRDLVRIDEHRGRAVRDHGAAELRHRHHAAFDMHVRVAQAGNEIAATGIHHLGALADGVRGVRPAIGESPAGDCNIGSGNDLARMDIDPAPVAHDEIRRPPAGRDIDQLGSRLRPRSWAC